MKMKRNIASILKKNKIGKVDTKQEGKSWRANNCSRKPRSKYVIFSNGSDNSGSEFGTQCLVIGLKHV